MSNGWDIVLLLVIFPIGAFLYAWILSKLFAMDEKKRDRHYEILRKLREIK